MTQRLDRAAEWAFRRPWRSGALLAAAIVVVMVLISLAGGRDTSPPAGAHPTVAATASAPVVTATGPRPTYRVTDDPVLIASTFVRSYLSTDVPRTAWIDAVTRHTTEELAEGLRRTDTATIPHAFVASRRPDVVGGIETGGAVVTVDLTDGSSLVVTMIYGEDTGQWLVADIAPGRRG